MNAPLRSAFFLALAATSLLARAADAYSNLDPAPTSYQANGYRVGGGFVQAFLFTATASGTLSGFEVAMNNLDASGNVPYTLNLYTNTGSDTIGDLLGAYSGTSTGNDVLSTRAGVSFVAATGAPVQIQSGTEYWIEATTPDDDALGWSFSNSATGRRHSAQGYFDAQSTAAFSVQVVPEPASLAAFGLGAVAFLRRRKRA